MRPCYTILLLCEAVFCGGCGSRSNAPAGDGPKAGDARATPAAELKDFRDLLGAWEVTAIEAAGKPVPADRVRKIRLRYIFRENQTVTISRPDRPEHTHRFTVDATTNPKRLTFDMDPVSRAVYAVEGDKLRLCLGAGYPTALASTASPTTDLLTLERR